MKNRKILCLASLLLAIFSAGICQAASGANNNHGNTQYPDHNCPDNPDNPLLSNGAVHAVASGYSSCVIGKGNCPVGDAPKPPTCPPPEPEKNPDDPCKLPGGWAGFSLIDAPDSLITRGERLWLEAVYGAHGPILRWGRPISFGPLGRLNYLAKAHLTRDRQYIRVCEPVNSNIGVFERVGNTDDYILVDGIDFGKDTRISLLNEENGIPATLRLQNPDGSSVTMEFETDTEIVSDFDGYVYRITERRTKHGDASTIAYYTDRVVLTDASGHEYICLIENDRIVEINFTVDGVTRRWTYTYNDTTSAGPGGRVTETNLQTGRTIVTDLEDRLAVTAVSVKHPDGSAQNATYRGNSWTRNGNVESHGRVVEDDGTVTFRNSVNHRVYDGYGLIRLEAGVGSIPDVTEYERNSQGQYTKKTDPLGRVWERKYDGNGRLLRELLPDGGETRYDYDAAGDMVARRIKVSANEWLEFRYSYDDAHRLLAAIDPEGGERRYVYDDRGLATHELVRVDGESWVVTAYTLDDNGQVLTVSHPYCITDPDDYDAGRAGDRLTVEYDRWGNQIRRTDAMGGVSTYEWSAANKLIAKVDPAGNRTEYTYNGLGQLTSETNPLGTVTTWKYNAQLNVSEVSGVGAAGGCAPCGGGAPGSSDETGRWTWSTGSLLTGFTDSTGRVHSFGYDDRRRLTSRSDIFGTTVYTYDAANNIIAVRDPNNEFTYHEYDEVGRRIATTDANGHTTRSVYDLAGRLVAVLGPDGSEIRNTYDGNSRLVASRVRVDESTWRERRIRYDLRGRMLETAEGYGTPEAIVTRFVRDADGRVIETVIDPDGLAITTRTEYDTLGRIVLDVDGNGDATAYEYDLAGNLVKTVSPEGRETAYEYDAAGRMIMSTLDPDGIGQFVATVYDKAGNVLETSDGASSVTHSYKNNLRSETSVGGQYTTRYTYTGNTYLTTITRVATVNPITTTMTYDPMGRVLTETHSSGRNWTYTYDAVGNMASARNSGNTTRFEYDAANRLTRVVKPLGNGLRSTYNLAGELLRQEGGPEGIRQFQYDSHGRIVAEIDGNGRSRRYGYDTAGRLVRLTNEMGQTVTYAYDGAGNRISLMDANLNVSTFSYDRDGNLVALTYPSVPGAPANVERYEYDSAGRLAVKTTPNGAAIRFCYDPAGKVEAMYTGDAVASADDIPTERLLVRYTYNGAGQVVREENAHTALTNTYDTLGRLSRVNFPDLKRRIDYSYSDDIVDEIKVLDTSKSPAVTVHTFRLDLNAAGEVTRAKQASDIYGTYGYDENGRRISLMAKSGAVQTYRYDTNDRLVELTIKKNDEVLAGFRYTHDGAGNRTGITYADGSRSVYEYDDAYRLLRDLRVDRDGGVLYDETYAYDAVGNRLRKTRTGGRKPVDVSYEYNARNQLVAALGDEAGEYEYDADGNLIRTVGPNGVEEREYDVLGRLTRYSGPGGTERYTHVAAGWKRHTAEYAPVDGEAKKYTFVYHGDNVIMDLVGDSLKHETTYLTPYLDENLLMYLPDVGYFYYGHDGLGSVRTITTGSGYLRNSYDYTAYGEPDPVAPFDGPLPTHQRYGFTGRENNPVAGDMFYRYRNYNNANGRFMKRDLAGYDNNVYGNLYEYVSARPHINKDPSGLGIWDTIFGPPSIPAIDCLNKICDQLPPPRDGECDSDQAKCRADAENVAKAYGDAVAAYNKVKWNPFGGWTGNVALRGCADLNDKIITAHSRLKTKFSAHEKAGIINFPMPHRWVVYSYPGSRIKCATTAWEWRKPVMIEYDKYEYRKSWPVDENGLPKIDFYDENGIPINW